MKAAWICLMFLTVSLAGCAASETATDDSAGPGASTPEATPSAAPHVNHGLMGPATTREPSIGYFVDSDGPVSVRLDLNGTTVASEVVVGNRSWTLELPHGRRALDVTLQAPGLSESARFDLVRLGATRLTVDYGLRHPSSPAQTKVDEFEIWIDVDGRPSLPLYTRDNGTHPDFFSAHDQLYLFETQTGTPVSLGPYSQQFQGYFVTRIDDVGPTTDLSGFWELIVNDVSSETGMSLKPVHPGDHVLWKLQGV